MKRLLVHPHSGVSALAERTAKLILTTASLNRNPKLEVPRKPSAPYVSLLR
jgi:hypothetical protein